MNLEFKTKEELYKKVYPALVAKKTELNRIGYHYIKEKDIWEYLSHHVFPKKHKLTLADVVSNIMHVEESTLDKYLKENLLKK